MLPIFDSSIVRCKCPECPSATGSSFVRDKCYVRPRLASLPVAAIKRTWLVSLFNNRFGIVFTNALARRGLLRFCDRLAVNERVLGGLQIIGNESVAVFGELKYPQKGPKMGVLRG